MAHPDEYMSFHEPGSLSRGPVRRRIRGSEFFIAPFALLGFLEQKDGTCLALTGTGPVPISDSYEEALEKVFTPNEPVDRQPVLLGWTLLFRGVGVRERGTSQYTPGLRGMLRMSHLYAMDRDSEGFTVLFTASGTIRLIDGFDALSSQMINFGLYRLTHPDGSPFYVHRSQGGQVVSIGNGNSSVVLRGGSSILAGGTPEDVMAVLFSDVR